jgi:alpha-beta hydrolase superfamily lysophospholipase
VSLGLAATGWAAACASLYWRGFGPLPWGDEADRGWTPEDLGIAHEPLRVRTEDGLSLQSWYLPGTRDAAIIVSNGYRGRAGDVLGIGSALQRAGFHVAVFGWRGTPGSDSAHHTLGVHECRDLRAVVDALTARLGPMPLGLLGYSMGGAVSIAVAADDPRVAAVCTDSAFSNPQQVLGDGVRSVFRIPSQLIVAPVDLFVAHRVGARLDELRPAEAVARLAPRPLLVIHGEADTTVRPGHARRLVDAAGEPKELWLLPGVGHVGAYFADRLAYVDRVTSFFDAALLGVDDALLSEVLS